MTVFIVTNGRDVCIAFADQVQAERFAELSGNEMFECDVRDEVEGHELLSHYEGA